jgi:DNA-binding protein WhiA
MEDERMLREIKNDVNRSVNCSTANIKKTANAALKQIFAIELLEKEGVLRDQSLSIRQMAEMRLEYPEASLDELAQMMNITKSGVNHRLRKLMHLAALLQGSEE